jgi:hypothetical protein
LIQECLVHALAATSRERLANLHGVFGFSTCVGLRRLPLQFLQASSIIPVVDVVPILSTPGTA